MKRTPLAILVTALIAWLACSFVHSARSGVERLWLVSAVKVPGDKAIADIQADMKAARNVLASAKLDALKQAWDRFDNGPDSFDGPGIGNIMVTFAKLNNDLATNNAVRR